MQIQLFFWFFSAVMNEQTSPPGKLGSVNLRDVCNKHGCSMQKCTNQQTTNARFSGQSYVLIRGNMISSVYSNIAGNIPCFPFILAEDKKFSGLFPDFMLEY